MFTGAERVARIFTANFGAQFRMRPIVVNGAPGLLLDTGEYPGVIAFSVDQGKINEIDVVRNPEKLGTLVASGR